VKNEARALYEKGMKYFKNEANEEEMSIAFQYFSKAAEIIIKILP